MIPLVKPEISDDDVASVTEVLMSGQLVQGPQVEAFEQELAHLSGTRHAVVLDNGTAALVASLLATGVTPGSHVIVPGYSWIATANAVSLVGATPVFVDIDTGTHAIDVELLAECCKNMVAGGEIPMAIVPVHPFGYVADMIAIEEIAARFEIGIIEDAACALGATLEGRPAGSIGQMGIFSFHPRKVITTGEGGALVTNDPSAAAFARAYRNHGQTTRDGVRRFDGPGDNRRMTDFQAALGRSQLRRLPATLEGRRSALNRYVGALDGDLVKFQEFEWERTAAQSAVATLDERIDRDRFIGELRRRGVETSVGTIDMTTAEHFKGLDGRWSPPCDVTRDVAARSISLPLWSQISSDTCGEVISNVLQVLDEAETNGCIRD